MKKQLLTIVSLICLVGSTNAQVSFDPVVNYAIGNTPYDVISADFNSDGYSDLATTNSADTNISILLGSASGVFADTVNYFVSTSPVSLASADFNGDGHLDLATANFNSNNVSILLGSAAGTFTAATSYPAGIGPRSVTSADFNGDTHPDLAVANLNNNYVTILLGSAIVPGTFTVTANYLVGDTPMAITSADFNDDGYPDLATVNYASNNVSILWGSATTPGTFDSIVNYWVGTGPSDITSADFNGDGVADLAISNYDSSNASILLGSAAGINPAVNYGTVNSPTSITSANFNGDGFPDLAIADGIGNNVSILLGSATGTFAVVGSYAVGSGPISLITADFNGDGHPDLATSNLNSNDVSVLLSPILPAAALNFDGEFDRVDIGPSLNTILGSSNKITVEAWVKSSTIAGLGCIIGNYNTNINNDMQFVLRRDGSNYGFYVHNGSGFVAVNSSVPVTIGAWQHVAGTWDGSFISIYVNGVISGTTAFTGTNINNNPNNIWIGANIIGENFIGSIDEVRIWNRSLCKGEILNNMNGELPMPQTGLLSYYKFNQGIDAGANATVTTLADSSGNANNGTLDYFALSDSTSNWIAPGAVTSGELVPSYTSLSASTSSQTNVSCYGGNNGEATLTANGGTASYSYFWSPSGGTNATASGLSAGDYTVTVTDSNDCVATQSVSITEPAALDNTTSTTNITITANATGVTYQWINCNNANAAIAGETNQSFTATANGNYAVVVTNGACSDTSACVAINSVGVLENNFGEDIAIFPNPTDGDLNIDLGTTYNEVNLIVRNTLGQEVFLRSFIAAKLLTFNISGDAGVYFIEVNTSHQQAIMRVIKK
jgi:hypothetical protein